MKYLILSLCITAVGSADAQPWPFMGYDLYDYLVTASHPSGCNPDYVTGLPNDSTWVNMVTNSVMTGYFGMGWMDDTGNDLLLETSYHRDNYSVRLILNGGGFSGTVQVNESDWTEIPMVQWKHIYWGCAEGLGFSTRWLLPLDFTTFGIAATDVVIGVEITFLQTGGLPDFAGAYIILPPCNPFSLGPDTTICEGETIDIDATTPGATYLWHDGLTDPVYPNAGPGQYYVEVTIDDCTILDFLNIYEATTTLELGNDTNLCEGETLLLDATTPEATYLWQDNSTEATFTVTQAGLYSVTVEVDGCVFTDMIQIDYLDFLELNLGNDTTLCQGSTLWLDASLPGATYEWQDNSTNAVFLVTEPGEYSVTATVNGCSISDEIDVTYTNLEPIELGNDTLICHAETLFLDAFAPGATYVWQDNSTSSSFTVSGPGNYSVTVSLDNCSTSDDIDISYVQEINVDLGEDVGLCFDEMILLDATTPGATYLWQDNSTSPTFTVYEAGTYSVVVSVSNCSASDFIEISYQPEILIDLGDDVALCPGENITLDATTSEATYEWQDHSTLASYTVTGPGVYMVVVTVGGCMASDEIEVEYAEAIAVDLGSNMILCAGETLLLDAAISGATYQWQDGSSAPTFFVSLPGTYTVSVSLGNCSVSDTVVIHYALPVVVDFGSDVELCPGETLLLDATTTGATYLWQDNSANSTFNVNAPGVYTVVVQVDGCLATDTIAVTYTNDVVIHLGNDTTLCMGETVLLDVAAPGGEYLWQDNSSSSSYLVDQPGTFWVSVTTGQCISVDTIQVSYLLLSGGMLGNDTTLCNGETLILDAQNPGASYLWPDNSTSSTLFVDQPGEYWVDVSLNHCSIRDTIAVQYEHPTPIALGNDTTLCQGATLVLTANVPGGTFQWQDNSTASSFLVTTPGVYWATALTGICSIADTIVVSYISLSPIELGHDTTLCENESLLLEAGIAGATYQWQDTSTAPVLLVDQPGIYWLQASMGDCFVRDTIQVEFLTTSSFGLGYDTALCPGDTLLLDATLAGANYQWQDNTMFPTLTVTEAGSYWVNVFVGTCQASDTIVVAYTTIGSIDLGNDTTLCRDQTMLLDASTPGASYMWQDGSTHPEYLVSAAGTYGVVVNVDHCFVTDTIIIAYLEPSSINLGNDTMLCWGQPLTLIAGAPGAQYHWSDNSAAQTLVVTQPGAYWVFVYLNQCATSDTIEISFSTPFQVDLGPDTVMCAGEILILDTEVSGAEYLWQDNAGSEMYSVSQSGLYWVSVQVDGCTVSDTIEVTYDELPSIHLGNDTILCAGEILLLNVSIPGATYLWQDHAVEPTFSVGQAGAYSVTVSLGECKAKDTIQVTYTTSYIPDLGPDKFLCAGETLILETHIPDHVEHIWQNQSTDKTIEVTAPGLFWLQTTDDCGIRADTISITLENCNCKIYVPNLFTPNGDQMNDQLIPQSKCAITSYLFRIFDRDGGLVFETDTWGEGWDGTVNSTLAQVGVYAYVLLYAFEDGKMLGQHGDLTIIR